MRLGLAMLKPIEGLDTDATRLRKMLSRPIQQRTGGTHLLRRNGI